MASEVRRRADWVSMTEDLAETAAPAEQEESGYGFGFLRWLGPVLVFLMLWLALYILRRELQPYHYRDIARVVRELPRSAILAAIGFTSLAYALLPGYDAIALAYVGRPLAIFRIGFGSFVAYGLSQTLGFPLLTGGSVRYRFWSVWGLSATEIAQAASFAGVTFSLGAIAICGVVFLLEPSASIQLLRLPVGAVRAGGAVCATVVATYLAWSARRREPLRLGSWLLPVPPPGIAIAQLAVAALDWAAAGAVLYVLLPPGGRLGFMPFLGAFLLAQFAGLASHVPGGVGVFDTLIVILLSPWLPAGPVVAALVAYRAIYYLLPFFLAVLMLAAYEIRHRRERVIIVVSTAGALAGKWVPAVVPYAISVTTFAAGTILLVSGVTPSIHGRIVTLDAALPLGVIELSHFMASVAGVGLLVLAAALRRRLDAAYSLTAGLLTLGIGASLLKGLDWEEATALALVLAVLLPCRREFYRKAALTTESFSPGWLVAVSLVISVVTWLGFFSYKHVQYSSELWWEFTAEGDAPRFLRATVGSLAALLGFALMRLFRMARVTIALPAASELQLARDVARRSRDARANLALLGDKALLFSDDREAFIMYGVSGRSWIALGDPIGSPAQSSELAWRFRELADRNGGWPVFYEATADALPIYIDLGLTLLKIGEEARVALDAFSLDGGSRKGLRRTVREVEKAGIVFEVVRAECVPAILAELRRVSDAWLEEKRTREKGFSLGRFDDHYLSHFDTGVARRGAGGPIVAFANVWSSASREEISVDLMRFTSEAPTSVMEYLFVKLIAWGKDEGYSWFSLGMAPLSGLERRRLSTKWNRIGGVLFRHGEHFYNFQGLRRYKEKFDPVWDPRYLASPGGLILPRILTNVATLISGGLRGVIAK